MPHRRFAHTSSPADAAAVIGVLLVGGLLIAAIADSPLPWTADPEPVLWALASVGAAGVAVFRADFGLAMAGLALLSAGISAGISAGEPNDTAGAIASVIPVVVGGLLASRPRALASRSLAAAVLLGWIAILAWTGSRAGWIALAAGLITLASLGGGPRRWRRALGLGSGVAVAVITAWRYGPGAGLGGRSPAWLDRWARGGGGEGWSWDSVLTGRPTIWRRAIDTIGELPRGIGPGRFDDLLRAEPLATAVGAPRPAVADAHQAGLQLALDLGLPGACVAIALAWLAVVRAVRAAWAAPPGTAERGWLGGVAGGLVATWTFGLVDTTALGTPAAVVSWSLIGLGLAIPHPDRRRDRAGAMVFVAVALLIGHGWQLTRLDQDHVARTAWKALLGHGSSTGSSMAALDTLEAATQRHPRAWWYRGLLHAQRHDTTARDADWSRLIASSRCCLHRLMAAAPKHERLAREAVDRWPTEAPAWLWLATAEHTVAERSLMRALALAPNHPSHPEAWHALGWHREQNAAWRAALSAYAVACHHGDPGANACRDAGRMAEHLGDTERAIGFYESSRWPPIRARAQRLRARD